MSADLDELRAFHAKLMAAASNSNDLVWNASSNVCLAMLSCWLARGKSW